MIIARAHRLDYIKISYFVTKRHAWCFGRIRGVYNHTYGLLPFFLLLFSR